MSELKNNPADEPMDVAFCAKHRSEINRDYVTYEILRCPHCLAQEIARLEAALAAYKEAQR